MNQKMKISNEEYRVGKGQAIPYTFHPIVLKSCETQEEIVISFQCRPDVEYPGSELGYVRKIEKLRSTILRHLERVTI